MQFFEVISDRFYPSQRQQLRIPARSSQVDGVYDYRKTSLCDPWRDGGNLPRSCRAFPRRHGHAQGCLRRRARCFRRQLLQAPAISKAASRIHRAVVPAACARKSPPLPRIRRRPACAGRNTIRSSLCVDRRLGELSRISISRSSQMCGALPASRRPGPRRDRDGGIFGARDVAVDARRGTRLWEAAVRWRNALRLPYSLRPVGAIAYARLRPLRRLRPPAGPKAPLVPSPALN